MMLLLRSVLKCTVSVDGMMIYILHKKFPTEIKERKLINTSLNPVLTVLLYILTLLQHFFSFFFLHSLDEEYPQSKASLII